MEKRGRMPKKRDVLQMLGQLAFGRPNDCVKLALRSSEAVDDLDLTLLSEIRCSEKGTVEVRLIDRLQALERLAEMLDDGSQAAELLSALQGKDAG